MLILSLSGDSVAQKLLERSQFSRPWEVGEVEPKKVPEKAILVVSAEAPESVLKDVEKTGMGILRLKSAINHESVANVDQRLLDTVISTGYEEYRRGSRLNLDFSRATFRVVV